MGARSVTLLAPGSVRSIKAGDDLATVILAALETDAIDLRSGDIVIVAQKIVSKAEGQQRYLGSVTASGPAMDLAAKTAKDPRLLELILQESREVVRARQNICIVEHRLGHIMANAGIDHSNLAAPVDENDQVLLLPKDPDGSARALRQRFESVATAPIGVIVSDSFGRPWRMGTTGVAIGSAGPAAVIDRRGERDRFGRTLEKTEIGLSDSVAAAAVLVMGEAAEGLPVVVMRGLEWDDTDDQAADVLRPRENDLFR